MAILRVLGPLAAGLALLLTSQVASTQTVGTRVSNFAKVNSGDDPIKAGGQSGLLFDEGETSVSGALVCVQSARTLRGSLQDTVRSIGPDPRLHDVRDVTRAGPRPKTDSPALTDQERERYIRAFGRKEISRDGWTVFRPVFVYDLRVRDDDDS